MQYQQIVDYIHGLPRMEGAPTLSRMKAALTRLGHPDRSYDIVHVAGTNGKGSTSAIMASIFTASGYRTGLFTSPFLDAFTNRIRIDGEDISHQELEEIFQLVQEVGREESLTQFEFITALGLCYFARRKADVVVLEVGLGGRFDATNAVSSPLLSVITNIGYDHMAILGNTLAQIAGEKAAIVRTNTPVITGAEDDEAVAVIEGVSAERHAALRRLHRDFSFSEQTVSISGQCFTYQSEKQRLDNLCLSLLGSHQLKNAALAVDAALWLRELGLPVSQEEIRLGLAAARWPGRFEVMQRHPMLIMDGSHNTHGMAALRGTLDRLLPGRPLRWVVGMMADKDVEPMLSFLSDRQTEVYACAPRIPRALPADELAGTAARAGLRASTFPDVASALSQALADCKEDEAVLVAGSLYVISEARAWWRTRQL